MWITEDHIIKCFIEAVITFKELLHHQSSFTPVQDGSLKRYLLLNVPNPFSGPNTKEKNGVAMQDYAMGI